jgi:4-hydroxythreonine-4-phosphate dehydrogenase
MRIITSIGDINGIGLETFIKSLNILDKDFLNRNEIALCGHLETIKEYLAKTNLQCEINSNGLKVNNAFVEIIPTKTFTKVKFGRNTFESGLAAYESLTLSANLVFERKFDALLTLPISKTSIHLAGFQFPGHTEMLADMDNKSEPLMILFNNQMNVALATIHIPIKEVASQITPDNLEKKLRKYYNSLINDFAIETPSMAVLGLNPHSGENNHIGDEEINIINPTLDKIQLEGLNCVGPFSADSFFAHSSWKRFDAIFAMYHDQGLIPLKMTSTDGGVNFTAGLSIVRTSPDHGTAFDIAGRNIANPSSTYKAIIWAEKIYNNKKRFEKT